MTRNIDWSGPAVDTVAVRMAPNGDALVTLRLSGHEAPEWDEAWTRYRRSMPCGLFGQREGSTIIGLMNKAQVEEAYRTVVGVLKEIDQSVRPRVIARLEREAEDAVWAQNMTYKLNS